VKRTSPLAASAVAVAVVVGGGCAAVRTAAAPTCSARFTPGLVLAAQAVPTADSVPCIAGYPAGWSLGTVHVRNGQASFTLDSDRAGNDALQVVLEASCDVEGATKVPSDVAGAIRYERILSVDGGFRAVRSYRFSGACVTYRFHFAARGQALVNEASLAVGFQSRAELDARLRAESQGRAHL
jgi:hypothetical protein